MPTKSTARRQPPGPRTAKSASRRGRRLTQNEAILAFLIAAMDANEHVSREELTRANHLIWSMRAFRRRSGESVVRDIERMRSLVEERGADTVLKAGVRSIPARLRPSVFAVAADLVLADGTLDASERRFLDGLSAELRLDAVTAERIRDVMLVKNRA